MLSSHSTTQINMIIIIIYSCYDGWRGILTYYSPPVRRCPTRSRPDALLRFSVAISPRGVTKIWKLNTHTRERKRGEQVWSKIFRVVGSWTIDRMAGEGVIGVQRTEDNLLYILNYIISFGRTYTQTRDV